MSWASRIALYGTRTGAGFGFEVAADGALEARGRDRPRPVPRPRRGVAWRVTGCWTSGGYISVSLWICSRHVFHSVGASLLLPGGGAAGRIEVAETGSVDGLTLGSAPEGVLMTDVSE